MSRIKKTIKNPRVGVFFYSITLFIHFFSRKIFLDGLGDEFIGLTSTLQSILGFLNLAELGIGTVIGVTLYGPLHKNDNKEINKIIALIGYLYRKIGLGTTESGSGLHSKIFLWLKLTIRSRIEVPDFESNRCADPAPVRCLYSCVCK